MYTKRQKVNIDDAAIFELNAAECRVDAVRRCVG